jgi:hypothetical protein
MIGGGLHSINMGGKSTSPEIQRQSLEYEEIGGYIFAVQETGDEVLCS